MKGYGTRIRVEVTHWIARFRRWMPNYGFRPCVDLASACESTANVCVVVGHGRRAPGSLAERELH